MTTTSISIESLSKRYRLGLIGGTTISDDVRRWWARLRRRPDPFLSVEPGASDKSRQGFIWALRQVDLEFEEGAAVGIIGHNGAGKTTLLKILSRITAPTSGQARIRGRLASLLEVGTGFHPELTGRENVFLNGAILGMTRAEVGHKLDEIVDFSGVEPFIETPVKRYSSGMRVRLAFAVAAHLEPEILLIDEVLSVGDAAFQKKCIGKMEAVTQHGRTVLFVSHQMTMVRSLCERVILLEAGKVAADGPADEVILRYLEDADPETDGRSRSLRSARREGGTGSLRFVEWWIRDDQHGDGNRASCDRSCEFHIRYEAKEDRGELHRVSVALTIKNAFGQPLTTGWTRFQNADFASTPPHGVFVCRFEELPLIPDGYLVSLWCSINGELADHISNAGRFEVTPTDVFGTGRLPVGKNHGNFFLKSQSWHCES